MPKRNAYKIPDEEFIEVVNSKKFKYVKHILEHLGLSPRGNNHDHFWERCERLNLDADYLHAGYQKGQKELRRNVTTEQVAEACNLTKSRASALKHLGLSFSIGSNIRWIDKIIETNKIQTDHWTGMLWNKISLDDHLKRKSNGSNWKIKKLLIESGVLKYECYGCGIGPEWNGKKITLELDHIDGDNTNNHIDNLRILCPNCHSQTPTFKRSKRMIESISKEIEEAKKQKEKI